MNDVTLGHDVKIFHPDLVNLYGCSIGDETKIGSFVDQVTLLCFRYDAATGQYSLAILVVMRIIAGL